MAEIGREQRRALSGVRSEWLVTADRRRFGYSLLYVGCAASNAPALLAVTAPDGNPGPLPTIRRADR
jgi:hypothetical protein